MNPHHHLHEATLISYAAGALPAALSVVVGTHLEQCRYCRQRLRTAEAIGAALLEQTQPDASATSSGWRRAALLMQLDRHPDAATPGARTPGLAAAHPRSAGTAGRGDPSAQPRACAVEPPPQADPDRLPASLHPYFGPSLAALRWHWIAPGVRCIRAEPMPALILLKIAPGTCLPLHSHGRSELTQILRGAYKDATGLFAPGDVADLDEDVEHQPVTAPGVPCICVAALDAPLVFSGWLARQMQHLVRL